MEIKCSYENLKFNNKCVQKYFEVLNQKNIALIGVDEEIRSVESELKNQSEYKINRFTGINEFLNIAHKKSFDLVVFSNEQDMITGERMIAEEINIEIISLSEIVDKLLRY